MEPQYEVFLSYNTLDRSSVEQIANKLVEHGIKVWFDVWEIPPGKSLLQNIDNGLRLSRSTAVFVGSQKLGRWQTPEMEVAIRQSIEDNKSVITVLLPGLPDEIFNSIPQFLLNNRYVDFREGLENTLQFDNLLWGITGTPPAREKTSVPVKVQIDDPAEQDPVEEAIGELIQILKKNNITFFLGPGATYGAEPMPAQASEIARELLTDLNIIENTYKELLPPFDVVSLYYGVKSGDRILEQTVTTRLASKSKVFPKTHDCLATLLKLLAKRPESRSGGRNLQLIVTTNLDLMAERALLRAGLPFTRVVQYRTGQRMDVYEYRHVQLLADNKVQLLDDSGQPQQARRDNFDELDQLIADGGSRPEQPRDGANQGNTVPPSFKKLTQPILYKFLGSQDIENSCVISTLHHFEFARSVVQYKALPEEITSTIRNSTILFLGLWFMDPDFRLTYYTLLRDAMQMDNDRRYALQLPPDLFAEDAYRRMERGIWQRIKEQGTRQMGITAIEEPCDVFLQKLYARVQSELGLQP